MLTNHPHKPARRRMVADRGSALVAAVGVSIIGMMLSVVVVAQAVVVTNDSQRDRVRTTEVHAAEAALDVALASLRYGADCETTSTYGSGSTETEVTVTFEYYNDDHDVTNPISCISGASIDTLAEIATRAVATATATPVNDVVGIDPSRTVAATVNLQAIVTSVPGAALFSGGSIDPGGGYSVSTGAGETAAAVWQDSGTWVCQTNNMQIDGSVYVPNGNVEFRNSGCLVTGNVWASGWMSVQNPPNSAYSVQGNITLQNGDLILSNEIVVGGNVSAGGNVPASDGTSQFKWQTSTVEGAICSANTTPCPGIEYYSPVGLPEIDYYYSDWAADGYTEGSLSDFADMVLASWQSDFKQPWQTTNLLSDINNNCLVPGHMTKLPILTTSTPTVYDLRQCDFIFNNKIEMELYADTTLMVSSLEVTNGLTVTSGDGGTYQFHVIVPDGGTQNNGVAECSARGSYTPGDIDMSAQSITVQSPIEIFLYTPCVAHFNNQTITYGQVYAGSVDIGATDTQFIYTPVDVPGVSFDIDSSSASSGYYVQIVNKREMR